MQGFRWHQEARLFGPDGEGIFPGRAFDPLPPPDPPGAALAAVLAGPEGAPFRIGGQGALEAGAGCLETLTGGSLGRARRVIRTQASWCSSFAVNAGLFGIGPGVGVAVPGALVHSLALYAAVEALHLGADLHLLDGLRPDRQAQAIARRGVAVLYATPAQLRQIAGTAMTGAWPSLRHVVIGGARLDGALRRALAPLAPQAVVHEFYGAAETSFITLSSALPGVAGDAASVGHAYPGAELRVDDDGLVWVRGPYLFQRYAGDDRGSARWDGEWLTVGEKGVLSAEGLILRGREGRMVTIADRNVFPEEVELFLMGLPGVERAAVLARPDPLRGHVLMACLQGDPRQEPAVLRALRQELGTLVAPRALVWRQDWPVLPSGKTDLAQLAAEVGPWR